MNDQAALTAGGIVPISSKVDDAVDTVVARAYHHAVLPGRTVIRLCASSVATGDDLEMSTLGFAAGEVRGSVGKERKRPLGFPGWALVHDPKNARYALDVVKELKKHARKAKSKPGHAKEAFDAIATKLAKTVPHFLPSFYEEVGRAFIEHGAITFAAAMFGKARQAEAVHALEVDEQHRIDGFLEFALAGAVTTKALSEYAKELSEHHEPKLAYAHFRQLCVQRTLGGMPPWSGMAKDLGRLAKAANLDVDKEDAALIDEIIESPALAKAAGEFWRAYAEPITQLGKQSATARGALLNLFPTGSSYNPELDDIWLDLLDTTGAADALTSTAEPEAQPNGGRAAWFDKLCAHLSRSWRTSTISPRAFVLLRRMAPALIADGKPIKASGRTRVDLDLAELALELGVAVAPIEPGHADAVQWAKDVNLAEHGRDPVHVAADPKLGPILRSAVSLAIGSEPFDTASRGKQGFLAAKRTWVEGAIGEIETAALPTLDATLAIIESKVSAATFAEMPDVHARFAAVDIAPALARTLRVGLIDELGWPALEDAATELDPDGKAVLQFYGGPPAVVIATKTRGIAIIGDQRAGVHDFVIPPKHEIVAARFIGNQFLVVLKEGYKVSCYWSSAPHDRFVLDGENVWSLPVSVSHAAVLADGAWLEALAPIRPGDRKLSLGNRLAGCDGKTAWITEWTNGEYRWREVTPGGELGRTSWPPWVEAFADADWKIDATSHYVPAPAGLSSSPIGIANGFIGTRIRWRGGTIYRPERREIETIDGSKLACHGDLRIVDLLALPDGGERRPLTHYTVSGKGTALVIYDPTCTFAGSRFGAGDLRFGRGQVTPVSSSFLHLFTARDVFGSSRIHAATDDDARALMAAVPTLTADQPDPADLPGLFPEVTHPRLRRGLAGVAAMAAQHRIRRDALATDRAPGRAQDPTSIGPDDAALRDLLGGWIAHQWAPAGSAWAQIERVGRAFGSPDHGDRTIKGMGSSVLDWLDLAALPSALAFLAVAVGTPAEKRQLAAQLHQNLVRALPAADRLRVLHVRGELEGETIEAGVEFQVRWRDGNAYAVRQWGYRGNHFHILEYAPAGAFKMLGTFTVERELRGGAGGPAPEELQAAVAAGSTSWNPDVAARLAAATGMTPSEAAYLWAGCPSALDGGANFLDKALRETLGLKAAQAGLARDALRVAKYETKIAAIDEAGRAGITALLDGSAATVLADAWKRRFGQRLVVPEELIAEADALSLGANVPGNPCSAGTLAMVLGGAESPQLVNDGVYAFDSLGTLIRASQPEPLVGQTAIATPDPAFDAPTLSMLTTYLPYLYDALAVGDPLRERAVVAYELALQRIAKPALWMWPQQWTAWLEKAKAEAIDKLLLTLGGEMLPGLDDGRSLRRIPGGAVWRFNTNIAVYLKPTELDAKAWARLEPIARVAGYFAEWGKLAYLRGDDLRAMMARIRDTPVPAGGHEQNPLLAVPKLVEKVAKKLQLSRDAAALYLQYLVLLYPSNKVLLAYNAWKPKQLADAQAELVEQELVLEAKRERAQRGYFLPGGWEALRSPHPPLETWKLPLYGTRAPTGAVIPTLGKFLPVQAFHVMFERAWARIESGDRPRYEEVKR